jgi:hypothetical protein
MGPSDVPYQWGPKARKVCLRPTLTRKPGRAGNAYLGIKSDDGVFGIGPLDSGDREVDVVLRLRCSEPLRRL